MIELPMYNYEYIFNEFEYIKYTITKEWNKDIMELTEEKYEKYGIDIDKMEIPDKGMFNPNNFCKNIDICLDKNIILYEYKKKNYLLNK